MNIRQTGIPIQPHGCKKNHQNLYRGSQIVNDAPSVEILYKNTFMKKKRLNVHLCYYAHRTCQLKPHFIQRDWKKHQSKRLLCLTEYLQSIVLCAYLLMYRFKPILFYQKYITININLLLSVKLLSRHQFFSLT